jgi:hypothetical protein
VVRAPLHNSRTDPLVAVRDNINITLKSASVELLHCQRILRLFPLWFTYNADGNVVEISDANLGSIVVDLSVDEADSLVNTVETVDVGVEESMIILAAIFNHRNYISLRTVDPCQQP